MRIKKTRELTKQQTKLLDAFFTKTGKYTYQDIIEKDITLWNRLVEINDTEILHQNVNRYLSDLQLKKLYAK